VRKSVTIVFSDLVDSSRLGQQLDPEALRSLLLGYFDTMRGVVDRHGGLVEKYIGDAVMAVFGVPVLHEDDALRAVRAAVEMRAALAELNRDFQLIWEVHLAARIGVNTGEVIAGDPAQGHMFVTGEAVNAAKRLQESADPDEVVISDATYRLVRDAVLVAPRRPRPVKHGEIIEAISVVGVRPHVTGRTRRFDAPFVGREHERDLLHGSFRAAVSGRTCRTLTVFGAAGIGKSRLVQEFVDALGGTAKVLRGRCLPYGEGITYWPLAEVVRDAVRADGQQTSEQLADAIASRLAGEAKAELIAERVAEAIGMGGPGGGGSEETFWAVRKLFEAISHTTPLVVVFDDLHWAEPTFLDLVEHIADCSRDVPILLVCIARPELLDTRPGWVRGRPNATSILLDSLTDAECLQLIANLFDREPLPEHAALRIASAAGGNALFAEELVAMLVDDELLTREADRWVAAADLSEIPVPSTINALLAARLEGLPMAEQTLLTAAAVEGTVFHRGAVGELTPDMADAMVGHNLHSLVRRDLIRPETSDIAGHVAYRFRHVLIRDAAYQSMPKNVRAVRHERYAEWLEQAAAERLGEFETIVGYHLEQAFRYRSALGSRNPYTAALASRSAQHLEAAGRRALARGDLPAAVSLLERASELLAFDQWRRAGLLPTLGAALIEAGRLGEAEIVLAGARQLAEAAFDECADAHALVQQQLLQLLRVEEGSTAEASHAVQTVIPVFERYGDHHGLCSARRLEAWLHWNAAHAEAAATAWEQAAAHARRAGDEDERSEILNWVASALFFGPTPVPEAIQRCDAIRTEVSGNLGSEAWTLRSLAGLHAMDGRFDLARQLLAESSAIFSELGQSRTSSVSHLDAIVEMLAGDPAAAEQHLLAGYRALEEMGDTAFLSTTAAYLAQAIFAQGRLDEAMRFTQTSEELAARDDLLTQVIWRSVRAGYLAEQGQLDLAEQLAREAVRIAEMTDFVSTHADALIGLATVLQDVGRLDDAKTAASEGMALYEQKGNRLAVRAAKMHVALLSEV
jgi:predicted ATPase/class 3 adenylate cyclase